MQAVGRSLCSGPRSLGPRKPLACLPKTGRRGAPVPAPRLWPERRGLSHQVLGAGADVRHESDPPVLRSGARVDQRLHALVRDRDRVRVTVTVTVRVTVRVRVRVRVKVRVGVVRLLAAQRV